MKYLLIIMVLLFATPNYPNATIELTKFISNFLRLYPDRKEKALSYIPTIITECGEDIDPLLIAVLISMESSWKFTARGVLGEVGLGQIMPKYAKGYQLEDPLEQVRASINHFRKALIMCKGNLKDATNAYGCGQCKPHRAFLKWRWEWYLKMKKRYRKEK
jgi:hypothetical protein